MPMVSLGRTVSQLQDAAKPMTAPANAADIPQYPGGAVIYLTSDELTKLGLNNGALEAGNTCSGTFQGIVTSTGVDPAADGSKQFRASIQITDMSLEQTPDADDRAATLYGSGVQGGAS